MSDHKPFLGPMPDTIKVRSTNIFFYPDVLTCHLRKTCLDNGLVKGHLRAIDEAARMERKVRIAVPERHVDNTLLQSMALQNIPGISMDTEKTDLTSSCALFPLDIVSALKKALVMDYNGHQKLSASFNAIEEYLVDQIVSVCALPQGSGDWCTFVSLRREDWDINEPVDWSYLCGQASKNIKPGEEPPPPPPQQEQQQQKQQKQQISSQCSENGTDGECDAKFARIIQSLLFEFGVVAFAAFFRLQDKKYHYYRVVLPLQRYRLKSKAMCN